METLSLYLFKSLVVSGLLTAWYFAGLRGRRLHQYNRFYLLTAMSASLMLPLLQLQLFTIPQALTGSIAPMASLIQPAGDVADNAAMLQQTQDMRVNVQAVVMVSVAVVSIALIIVLLARLLSVYKIYRRGHVEQHMGVSVVMTDSQRAPFTFLKYVYWDKSIAIDSESGSLIFMHEQAHIKQGHTYDKLFCQLVTCICWFNPFYWIMQKELNIVHEFIADEYAIGNRDTGKFALMMLRSCNIKPFLAPEHYFFSSAIKRRLEMLQVNKKPSNVWLRRLAVLPVIAGAVLLFSFGCRSVAGAGAGIKPADKKIVVLVDAAHGGNDAGATAGGFTEKDICLKCAQRIQELAPAYNIEVKLTRDDDHYLPLSARVAMAEKVHPDLVISLHVNNKPGTDKAKGDFDICISGEGPQVKQSNSYSNAMFREMVQGGIIPGVAKTAPHQAGCRCGQCVSGTDNMSTKAGYYLLKNVQAPCMIMVLGDIHNTDAMKQLEDNGHLDILCNAILKGIAEGRGDDIDVQGFLGNSNKGKCN